jgi:hypothetical protein
MKVTVNSGVLMNRLEGGTIDEGGGVGSYEPGRLVRGGLMGCLSVSVVDLMGRIGAGAGAGHQNKSSDSRACTNCAYPNGN